MLCGLLARIRPARILLIGDLLLDLYTYGKVERISPEAPVSILHVSEEMSQPGGAGNVAINLHALGATVMVIGRVGRDAYGSRLVEQLEQEGVDMQHILIQEEYMTPVKNRFIAESQQILRVDREATICVTKEHEKFVFSECEKLIKHTDLVAISDYAKGLLTPSLIQSIIDLAKKAGRRVIVDPKGEDFSKYAGASVLKPNLKEAYAATKQSLSTPIDVVAEILLSTCRLETLLITRGGDGMSLFQRGEKRMDVPILSREVKDVTGAGDTVLAMISLALANGLSMGQAAHLANTAANIAIERVGCARVGLEDLAKQLLQTSVDNKIFSEEHLFAFERVLHNKRCILLSLNTTKGITNVLFRCIRKLSGLGDFLIAYIRDPHPDPEYIAFLSSLPEIQFIVLESLDVKNLIQTVAPHALFAIEGEKLVSIQNPEQIFG